MKKVILAAVFTISLAASAFAIPEGVTAAVMKDFSSAFKNAKNIT